MGSDLPPVSNTGLTGEVPGPLATSAETAFDSVDFDDNATQTGSYYIPPDSHSATGPAHIVNVVNAVIQIHDKSGSVTFTDAIADFFSALTPLTDTFDPKVIYDQYHERFVVVTLEVTDTAGGDPANTSRLFIAVSDDSNPNGNWRVTSVNSMLNIGGSDHWLDYPGLAVDEEAVYVTGNMFTFGNSPTYGGTRLWIVAKGAGSGGLYDAGGTASVTLTNPYSGGGFAMTTQPAHMFGAAPAGVGTYLVGYSGLTNGTNEFIQVIRLDDPLGTPTFSAPASVLVGNIDDTAAAMPEAPQPDTSVLVATNGRRALSAVWRDAALWLTTTVVPPAPGTDAGQATAFWSKLDTSVSPPVSDSGGFVGGEDIAAGTHTYFPAIAVGPGGDAVVGFSASASTVYPGAYMSIVTSGSASEELRAGTDYYIRTFDPGGTAPVNRWGDYSSVSVDPVDGCFWVYNEYATTRGTILDGEDGRWATANGKWCVPIFLDGFESGDTSMWSATVP